MKYAHQRAINKLRFHSRIEKEELSRIRKIMVYSRKKKGILSALATHRFMNINFNSLSSVIPVMSRF